MRKHIANIISTLRIVAGASLFFVVPFSKEFIIIYVFCGLSDVLDGMIARATNTTSVTGSLLDTAGDIVTYSGLLFALLPKKLIPIWTLGIIGFNSILFIVSGLIGRYKHGVLCLLHTSTSKSIGLLAFCYPLFCTIADNVIRNIYLAFACAMFTWSSIEAILIQIRSKELDFTVSSIFYLIHLEKNNDISNENQTGGTTNLLR